MILYQLREGFVQYYFNTCAKSKDPKHCITIEDAKV